MNRHSGCVGGGHPDSIPLWQDIVMQYCHVNMNSKLGPTAWGRTVTLGRAWPAPLSSGRGATALAWVRSRSGSQPLPATWAISTWAMWECSIAVLLDDMNHGFYLVTIIDCIRNL
jgi:hypothetical protein